MSSTGPNASAPQEDEVKKAADLREWLETKILELEDELNKHKEMLTIVDSELRRTSFVPATELRNHSQTENSSSQSKDVPSKSTSKIQKSVKVVPQAQQPAQSATESEQSRSLRRTKDGMLLANAIVTPDSITIVPASDVKLPQTTPPFQTFFINRILKGYESRDLEMSQAGTLQSSEVLKYEVAETDGHIEKIVVRNYRDKSRLNEILNTVNWAFSRMLEKK